MNHIELEQRFSADDSCIDYRSYIFTIGEDIDAIHYEKLRTRLMKLGRAEKERMGVVYVRGPWGFFVIPHHGYPTLRISFFHDTPDSECDALMMSIIALFDNLKTSLNRGDSQ